MKQQLLHISDLYFRVELLETSYFYWEGLSKFDIFCHDMKKEEMGEVVG